MIKWDMKYRTLGRTGLRVSEVGMGTWQLANDPNYWIGSDLEESYKCLGAYVEAGGNFIDTAWIYGYDDKNPEIHPSEMLVGKYLKESGNREKIVLATKIPPKNMNWPAPEGVGIDEAFPTEWVEKCVNDSLISLQVETIDLMQFHVWQDQFVERDEWKIFVEKTKKSGKVRFFGISINDYQPENCIRTLDTGLIDTIQFIFNVFHQKPTEVLLPYAKKNNIGLIARVPLDEGGLSGKFNSQTVFETGDFRSKYFSGERLVELEKRIDELKKLLEPGQSVADLALRYILSFDEVSSIIPGMRRLAHVAENSKVSDEGKLSEGVMQELKKHSWERNFYPTD